MNTNFPKVRIVAFSSEDDYQDTSMFRGEVVEHTTSWLTINPYKGCSLKCAYCFRVKWGAGDVPEEVTDVEAAIEQLIKHADFVPNITPISINISSTDVLLPSVKKSTFRAIELMEVKKLRNPFGLTTKLGFAESEIRYLESLQFVRPIVFVSLAFMPRHIEPIGTRQRIRNLMKLSKTRIPTVLYFRPIVEGWNDSDEIIEKVLQLGKKYADAICIGSLRMSSEIRHELQRVGALPPSHHDEFNLKRFGEALEKRVFQKYHALEVDVPLYKHTSCAVSQILGVGNYNLLYRNPQKNCVETCPKNQQQLCGRAGAENE